MLRVRDDAYAVLRAARTTPAADVRSNYRRLSLLVHPDRCRHPAATEAAAAVNRAHAILSDPLKKKLYDVYAGDGGDGAGRGGRPGDWEEAAAAAASLPQWMQRLLLAPGGACCALLLLIVLLIPALGVALVLTILCLPLRAVGLAVAACGRCCRPKSREGDVEAPPPPEPPAGTARERAEARAAARAAAVVADAPPVIVLGPAPGGG